MICLQKLFMGEILLWGSRICLMVVEVKSTMVRPWQVQMWLPILVATESRYDVARLASGGLLNE